MKAETKDFLVKFALWTLDRCAASMTRTATITKILAGAVAEVGSFLVHGLDRPVNKVKQDPQNTRQHNDRKAA